MTVHRNWLSDTNNHALRQKLNAHLPGSPFEGIVAGWDVWTGYNWIYEPYILVIAVVQDDSNVVGRDLLSFCQAALPAVDINVKVRSVSAQKALGRRY